MIWARRKSFCLLNKLEKTDLVLSLQQLRKDLLAESVKKRRTKRSTSPRIKKPKFKNSELNDLFNKWPADLQKMIMNSKKRMKV